MPGAQNIPTNLFSTFDSGFFGGVAASGQGLHEDLVDLVTILDSFQTPMFSSAPKVRARDVVHSWMIDALAATATAGVAEGVDFVGDANLSPIRLYNVTQIFSKHVLVSDRERAANPAGIRDMYEFQVMKRFKECARDAEARIWAATSPGTASGAEATTAPLMAGFRGFAIQTAASASGGVVFADIITMSQQLFDSGAEPDSMWFAPASKRQFYNVVSGNRVNTLNIAATDQRLVANIDVFESPFGQLFAVITDRFIPMTAASNVGAYYIGDRAMAKIAFFRPPQHKPMGKSGDHTRGIVLMELTLQLDHPSAWYAMTAVTNG